MAQKPRQRWMQSQKRRRRQHHPPPQYYRRRCWGPSNEMTKSRAQQQQLQQHSLLICCRTICPNAAVPADCCAKTTTATFFSISSVLRCRVINVLPKISTRFRQPREGRQFCKTFACAQTTRTDTTMDGRQAASQKQTSIAPRTALMMRWRIAIS